MGLEIKLRSWCLQDKHFPDCGTPQSPCLFIVCKSFPVQNSPKTKLCCYFYKHGYNWQICSPALSFTGSIHTILGERISHWPGLCKSSYSSCPVTSWDLPALPSPVLRLEACATTPGMELTPSGLFSRDRTDWTNPLTPYMDISHQFYNLFLYFSCFLIFSIDGLCVSLLFSKWLKLASNSICSQRWPWISNTSQSHSLGLGL